MGKTLRVLYVEDSEQDATLLSRRLARAGYDLSAERVETPEQMRAALAGREWDVILCDYSMPHFGAPAALALLKETGLDIPFIIISGTVGEETAVEAVQSGADDYLMKDSLARLVPAIERGVQEAESRRARRLAEEALRESEDRYRDLVEHSHDLTCTHDMEGRKRSQERLETSEGRFRQMAENIDEVFRLVDPNEGAMLYVSPAYEEIWGRTCRSLYERPASYAESVHPKDRVRVSDASERQRRGERTEDEYRIVRPDGSVRWIHDRAFPIKGESGEVSRIVGIAEDITERKQLEEELRQSHKMEAVGRLAGGIAHDFNNLLTAINGYSDLALRRLQAEDPVRKSVEEIRKAGERAAALTRQLLAFSGKQLLQPVVLDLNSVVSDMEKMLRRLIGQDVELRTALAHDLGSIKADPGQVEQVIMNLCVNARDAMPSGGKLTIETANAYLGEEYAARRLTDFTPGPYVVLKVTDTGTGMDDQTRERIFEPFFTTKGAGKGTGLGLSTVYGIVRQSGGSVRVSSEVGRGSTFEVYFPRAVEGAQGYRRGAEPEEVLRGAETILLAEDEEMVRRLAREVLEMYGYRVLVATGGGAALLICERHEGPISLLVTDIVMPEMSGRELAARLAQMRPEMKVLYMSGYTDASVAGQESFEDRADFLQKPFTPAALARKVREILDRT